MHEVSRHPIIVDSLFQIAQSEDSDVESLTKKGNFRCMRKFMELFNLSIHEITETAGHRKRY